jgi:hypothetical protein
VARSEEQVRRALEEMLEDGLSRRDAAREVARRSGWPRNDVVQLAGRLAGPQAGESPDAEDDA